MADIKRFGTNFDKLTWPPRATYSAARQPDPTGPNEPNQGYTPAACKKNPRRPHPFRPSPSAAAMQTYTPGNLFFLLSPCPYLYRLSTRRGSSSDSYPTVHRRIIDLTQRRAVIVNFDFSRAHRSPCTILPREFSSVSTFMLLMRTASCLADVRFVRSSRSGSKSIGER